MTDLASLGLEIRSDGVAVASNRLQRLKTDAGAAGLAATTLRRLWVASLAAIAGGMAAFGVGIGAAVKRLDEMQRLSRQLDRTISNVGNTARTSASEVRAWAEQQEFRTGRAAEEIMAVATNLTTFGFSREAFFRALALADDMSAAWGGDLKQNIEGLGRALAEPEKGLAMLQKRGITFTDTQKAMIAGFLQTNDLAGAQGIIFDALEEQVKGVAEEGYGGLRAAFGRAQEVWEQAFEDMVEGTDASTDLRGSLIDLATVVSSPEFIAAAVGFGNVIVQIIKGIADVVIGAHQAFRDFMAFLNRAGGPVESFNNTFGPVASRSTDVVTEQLQSWIDARDEAQKKFDDAFEDGVYVAGRDAGGWAGSPAGVEESLANMDRIIAELEAEVARRAAAVPVDDIGGGAGDFNSMVLGFRAPGSMTGFDGFDPYEGMTFGGEDAEKARKAYDDMILSGRQFIAEQELEARALGMTAEAANALRYEQEMLVQAANDNIALGPRQREEIAGLAKEMAAAEEQARRLAEVYNFGKEAFGSFITGIASSWRTAFADSEVEKDAARLQYVSELLTKAQADGAVVTAQQRNEIIELSHAMADAEYGATAMERAWKAMWESIAEAGISALDRLADRALGMAADGIFDMLFNGLMSGITGGLSGATTSATSFIPGIGGLLPSANGNVFNSPGLSAYSGTIVSSPTMFPFASGMGLMGEAGPEAILPLRRGSNGKLGVEANNNQPPAANSNDATFRIEIVGARGNAEIYEMAYAGAQQALKEYRGNGFKSDVEAYQRSPHRRGAR